MTVGFFGFVLSFFLIFFESGIHLIEEEQLHRDIN